MVTSTPNDSVASALFGKTQRGLLALFFARPDESFYLRQITRLTYVGLGAAQRELARWVNAGLLTRTRRGNQVHYQANRESPVFPELKALSIKTMGVADVVRQALARIPGMITLAFIHGSVARGEAKHGSDVDVVVVGDTTFGDVASALSGIEAQLGREVNPTVYTGREFQQKRRAGHHFLTTVMSEPKVFLVGDERELDRLGA